MTAFASCEIQSNRVVFLWEIRSVNHRYLDFFFRLPDDLRDLEPDFRRLISQNLNRGKIDCFLSCRHNMAEESDVCVDLPRVRSLIAAADSIASLKEGFAPYSALDILKWPGVQIEPRIKTEDVREPVIQALQSTLTKMIESRQREGAKLAATVEDRRCRLQTLVSEVSTKIPTIRNKLRTTLISRLDSLSLEVDSGRFEQELVYQLQKMDVDEELDRLCAHLDEVSRILSNDDVAGRRLDFLLQELNREANTLGSKSVDLFTTQASVEMKVLIEQMREQIQNIE